MCVHFCLFLSQRFSANEAPLCLLHIHVISSPVLRPDGLLGTYRLQGSQTGETLCEVSKKSTGVGHNCTDWTKNYTGFINR